MADTVVEKDGPNAFLDIYVDGQRFRIEVGDFHDLYGQRRGLHIIGPIDMQVQKTSVNAASICLPLTKANVQQAEPKCTCADFDGFVTCPVHI